MTRILDRDLERLRELLLRMGSRAEAILDKSLRALFERDPALAEEVERDDVEIDRLDVAVDEAVLKALALRAPVAEDLRTVVAAKMVASDLERVGDLARNIAKSATRLSQPEGGPPPENLARLARAAQLMLKRALDAFSEHSVDAAREVLDADDAVDSAQDEVVRGTIEGMAVTGSAASEAVDLILVAKHLERVGDHATNIAEDVILMEEARNVKHAAKLEH